MERGRWTSSHKAAALLALAFLRSALSFAWSFFFRASELARSSGVYSGMTGLGLEGPGCGAVVAATAALTGVEGVAKLMKARCFFSISIISSCVSRACSTVLGATRTLGVFSPLTTLEYWKGAAPVWERPWY